jgi:hypothetical protein
VLRREPRRAEIRALSPARYSLHVTLSADTHHKLRQAQALLRHVVPTGDPAEVIDRALTLLVAHLERQKHAALRSTRPRKQVVPRVGASPEGGAPDGAAVATVGRGSGSTSAPPGRRRSRYIPAAVRRAVWERDEGQCTFVGEGGRCTERAFLEFHHRVPFADGGASTVENVALTCRVHNAYEADRFAPLTVLEPCVPYRLCPDRVHTLGRMAPPDRRARGARAST